MALSLTEKEKKALELMSTGAKEQAAQIFSEIVEERPDWEHGFAFYNLAGCLEDLGRFAEARHSYLRAIDYGPGNTYFWGAYASFLYLHGSPEDAFEAYLRLLRLERAQGGTHEEGTMTGLRSLAAKLGMDEAELATRIKET